MNHAEALSRLDEIELLDPDPSVDIGTLGIMAELSQTDTGLHLLIDRYADSSSAHIVGFLAFTIAERSKHSTPEMAPLVFEFVGKLKRDDYEAVLLNSLSAMDRQFSFGAGWGESSQAPACLFPFIEHCMSFSGKLNVLVRYAALELVTAICWRGVLRSAFTAEQIEWIGTRVKDLSQTDNELLVGASKEFWECAQDLGLEKP